MHCVLHGKGQVAGLLPEPDVPAVLGEVRGLQEALLPAHQFFGNDGAAELANDEGVKLVLLGRVLVLLVTSKRQSVLIRRFTRGSRAFCSVRLLKIEILSLSAIELWRSFLAPCLMNLPFASPSR